MKRSVGLFLAIAIGFCTIAEAGRIRTRQAGESVTLENGEKYFLTRALGAGAVGTVYRATKPRSDEVIAIKFFSPAVKTMDLYQNVVDGFSRAAEMKNPSLLPFRFEKLVGGELVVLMPAGEQSLQDYLDLPRTDEDRLRTAKEIFNLMQPLLRDLLRRGYHFGDIKPSNIVRVDGHWKVIDFDSIERIGLVSEIYTSGYAPAEIRRHQRTHWTSDSFSVGRTLGSILLGEFRPDSILDAEKWSQLTLQKLYQRYPQFRKPEFQEMRRFLAASLAELSDERSARLSRAGFGNACNKIY